MTSNAKAQNFDTAASCHTIIPEKQQNGRVQQRVLWSVERVCGLRVRRGDAVVVRAPGECRAELHPRPWNEGKAREARGP